MKRKVCLRRLLCLLLCMSPALLPAQHDLSLYNMKIVPQRIFQNPAFIPAQKVYVGIPVLSGIRSSMANPFSYNDVFERGSDDSLTLRVENTLAKLAKNERLRLYSDIEVLSLGSRLAGGKFFLGFSIRERISQHVMVPEDLVNMLWYGNAAPQVFGRTVSICPRISFIAFDEWGASFSGYALKNKITWGGRLKYISGRVNATTVRSTFDVSTDPDSYRLNMQSDLELRTSGIDDIEHYLDQPLSSLVFPGNNGVGVDLGATWQITEQIGVSASVLDLGFVSWKSRTMTLVSHIPGEEFTFNGLNLNDFIKMIEDPDTFGGKLTDSILDLVEIDTVYDVKYTSMLPVRFNVGGTYTLKERHNFNLLLNGVAWDHHFFPALSVSYYYQAPRILGILLSYNIFNNQYTNFGAGLSVNAGPIQLYVISDNLPAMFWYRSSNNYSVQFGINISVTPKTVSASAETQPAQ